MPNARVAPFVMHGSRDAIAGGLVHIEEQVKGIELAVAENPGLAFDLAKTLVESVCRTVLGERNIVYAERDDLPRLFKAASQNLPFLPSAASGQSEIRDSLRRTLGGLSTAIQGICELRNQCGFASQGSGLPRPSLQSAQATGSRGGGYDRGVSSSRPPPGPHSAGADINRAALYEDNQDFNDSVDEAHGSHFRFIVPAERSPFSNGARDLPRLSRRV
jgi:hypothetical protein